MTPRLIDWTGERCVPWAPDVAVIYEHFHRYLWAAQFVRGRRVLDLGSGEGFGAAILRDVAAEVVGIDIDETTVEHSRLNYARDGLSFQTGSAADLSMFDSDSFGAVVAFEVIEHLAEQEEVLAEIVRVLGRDGILVMSTPDRQVYSEETEFHNPFHVRELSLDEFTELLSSRFEHGRLFGQSTITGSQIEPLRDGSTVNVRTTNFWLTEDRDGWAPASGLSARYLIAIASNAPLDPTPSHSTLADPKLGLVRQKVGTLEGDVSHLSGEISRLYERLVAAESELDVARRRIDEFEGSVTITAVRSLSATFYGLVPKDSALGRMLQATLRLIGRLFMRRDGV